MAGVCRFHSKKAKGLFSHENRPFAFLVEISGIEPLTS